MVCPTFGLCFAKKIYGYMWIYHLNVSKNRRDPHLDVSNTSWCINKWTIPPGGI